MRYLLYPFALTLLLTAAITGALLIGRAQPLPDRVAVLHLNDICKLPCWIGITPDVTTLGEAEKLVQSVYKTDEAFRMQGGDVDWPTSTIDVQNGLYTISFATASAEHDINEKVLTIWLALSESKTSTSNLYPIIGVPQMLGINGLFGSKDIKAYYRGIQISSRPGRDFMFMPIDYLIIADSPDYLPEGVVPWQGYKSYIFP